MQSTHARPTRFLVALVLMIAVVPAAVEAGPDAAGDGPGLDSRFGFHSYLNVGQAWSQRPATSRVDQTRYLAIPGIGIDVYPSPRWRVSLSGESLIGFIAPSLLVRGTVDYHPLGSQSDGPFATFGARWVAVNAAIICSNDDPSCRDEASAARTERQQKPADAFGPTVTGVLGELGFGYQARVNAIGLYALASYQGGYLTPTPASASSDAPPLDGYYHGYLFTVGLRTF